MDIEKIGNKVENENNEKAPKKALGRGLAALLGGSGDNFLDEMDEEFKGESEKITVVGDGVQELDIEKVQANPDQPRKHFNHAKLAELAESIKEQGLIQPILVKPVNGQNGEEVFQIIAGERRWRAHQIAELKTVKAIVVKKEESDEKNDLASVIENIQREELNAIELAEAYARLIELYSFTQEKLAKKVGISRVALANTLRLNRLPQKVKGMIVGGQLSEGHGRSLLALEKEEKIIEMAEQVLSQKMSVREVEEAVRRALGKETKGTAENPIQIQVKDRVLKEKSSEFLSIEEDLRHKFGTKVQLRGNKTRGMIEIYFTGEDSLSRLLHLLKSVEN